MLATMAIGEVACKRNSNLMICTGRYFTTLNWFAALTNRTILTTFIRSPLNLKMYSCVHRCNTMRILSNFKFLATFKFGSCIAWDQKPGGRDRRKIGYKSFFKLIHYLSRISINFANSELNMCLIRYLCKVTKYLDLLILFFCFHRRSNLLVILKYEIYDRYTMHIRVDVELCVRISR